MQDLEDKWPVCNSKVPVPCGAARHLLHFTWSFGPGGAQRRVVQIINHLGGAFRHTIVALVDDFRAAREIDPAVEVSRIVVAGSRNPFHMIRRFASLLNELQPNLALTYNWGSIDAVVAARLSVKCPLIHTEDGFGDAEALGQKRRRVLFRRAILRSAYRVVAPSEKLLDIMLRTWKLPPSKIQCIPNGVDTQRFRARAACSSVAGTQAELILGTVGHLRREKRQDLMLEFCAALNRQQPVRLVIAGEGPERSALEQKARSLDFVDRVTFLGHRDDVEKLYQGWDIFVLTSSTEQMPLSILEAMACGLPIVSTDVGDIWKMVSVENRPFIVQSGAAWEAAILELAKSVEIQRRIGAANRTRCTEAYSLEKMLARYTELYLSAIEVRTRV